ncbi:MAG: aminodeoxychorismate/anthranilate synthase component II [Dehalococcoidia bacterium]|jgi:anthranilate synthase component 2|nr:aminodeoxychorismate/anthranilate synthase component II [Dehalococcoidia bacterium]
MLLLIDNYDSFTFNLYQYLAELGETVEVVRNDEVSVEDCLQMAPERVVISPGPGTPNEAGISVDLVRALERTAGAVPLLGVCLGHQCIGAAFGGTVGSAGEIMHGKTSAVTHDGAGVFEGLPNPFEAIRYHSLAIEPDSVPAELEVTARAESGVIMGVRHRTLPIEGVQFHPESIVTEVGHDLLRNFLRAGSAATTHAAPSAG